ncbi:MAG: PEP-CTERM sorting domain-containing protein [Methylotenera sp.]|nr:PEP-CTERM sorting domain-containing protein [Methylotenera sp.]
MKRLINLGFLFLILAASQVRATPMLAGSVSFDGTTDLFTYTYTLDTSEFEGNIANIDIWQNIGFNFDTPFPVSHTEPLGWMFVLSVGSVGNGPFGSEENIAGSFWSWWKNPGDVVYDDIQTFSFTTERSVTTSRENNYGLYNNHRIIPTGYIEIGHIVGPALVDINDPVSPVPENETYAMMMAGLGVLGFIGRRKHQRT